MRYSVIVNNAAFNCECGQDLSGDHDTQSNQRFVLSVAHCRHIVDLRHQFG
jgi:hypothetical protein